MCDITKRFVYIVAIDSTFQDEKEKEKRKNKN